MITLHQDGVQDMSIERKFIPTINNITDTSVYDRLSNKVYVAKKTTKKEKLKNLAQVAPVLNINYLDKIFNIKARTLNSNFN